MKVYFVKDDLYPVGVVVAVFSTDEKAREYANYYNYSDVEEVEVDTGRIPKVGIGQYLYRFLYRIAPEEYSVTRLSNASTVEPLQGPLLPVDEERSPPQYVYCTYWATDDAHAEVIAKCYIGRLTDGQSFLCDRIGMIADTSGPKVGGGYVKGKEAHLKETWTVEGNKAVMIQSVRMK